MAEQWEIEWERDQDHSGEKRAVSIGPIFADHDHWSGWTIADESDALKAAAAPLLLEACQELLQSLDNHLENSIGRRNAKAKTKAAIKAALGERE